MPAPAAVVAAGHAAHHRHQLVALAITVVAGTWLTVMSVVVVAMGGTPDSAALVAATGIPTAALDAYQQAAASAAQACGLRWQVLAGIGRVESNHAAGRIIASDGTVAPAILGPVLDGTGGTARVADTDDGSLDGHPTWDRAVGPMQLLPATWRAVAVDGNDDGRADPNNLYDAAGVAATLLCAGGAELSDDAVLRDALFAYNRSEAYVADVMAWIAYYDETAASGSGAALPTGTLVTVRGITVDASIAANLEALLAGAEVDGIALGGSGYRSHDAQIALRRAHCGTSTYAIYDMPAAACSPPTARPGHSRHEAGLAIDFTCAGTLIVSRSSPCHVWLVANAAAFGLQPLEAEPWHWSVDGQ